LGLDAIARHTIKLIERLLKRDDKVRRIVERNGNDRSD
jgi:hypothetical protein